MVEKIDGHPDKILEPSAGKGDIVEGLNKGRHGGLYGHRQYDDISAIEIDKDLRATLRGKHIKVIDTDFLQFSGPDKFDLIIANPPFNGGANHLLKAIDIMYSGQIIFLLNAETIRNPHTRTRQALVQKLDELSADIEYIENAFKSAERPTGVEIALVDIRIKRQVEDDIFRGCDDQAAQFDETFNETHEVTTGKRIPELVAEYNQIIHLCTDTIVGYFKNYKKICQYVALNREPDKYYTAPNDMTEAMRKQVNDMLMAVRKDFWQKTLNLPDVEKRMTAKKLKEFEVLVEERCDMDFTEGNIRNFVLNLIESYEQTLTEAVLDIFDKFTRHGYCSQDIYEKNVHYFDGWKTNSAFKVGPKVIIPIYGGYGSGPFIDDYSGKWDLDYGVHRELNDIDIVMNYFDGMSHFRKISQSIQQAFSHGRSRDIHSTYFKITCYKKGTIHLTFRDEGILRRFNVVACKGKKWLPPDYGAKPYSELTFDEKAAAKAFEGKKSYEENRGQPLFSIKPDQLQIDFRNAA